MEKLEECILKKMVKSNEQLISLDKKKEDCLYCNGYNDKCYNYTLPNEDCFGL